MHRPLRHALAIVLACGIHSTAHAQSGESSLLPSALEEQSRRAYLLAKDLERTFETLPHVLTARVHVALSAPPDLLLLGQAGPTKSTASVVVKSDRPLGIPPDQLKRVISGAVSSIDPADVSILIVTDDHLRAEPLEAWGPIEVAHHSHRLLSSLAAGALLLVLLLSLGLAITSARLIAMRRKSPLI